MLTVNIICFPIFHHLYSYFRYMTIRSLWPRLFAAVAAAFHSRRMRDQMGTILYFYSIWYGYKRKNSMPSNTKREQKKHTEQTWKSSKACQQNGSGIAFAFNYSSAGGNSIKVYSRHRHTDTWTHTHKHTPPDAEQCRAHQSSGTVTMIIKRFTFWCIFAAIRTDICERINFHLMAIDIETKAN